jgi:hypothetical protein
MEDIITTAVGPYNVRATSETVASSDSVDAAVEQVWSVLPGVYEGLGIPLGGMEMLKTNSLATRSFSHVALGVRASHGFSTAGAVSLSRPTLTPMM